MINRPAVKAMAVKLFNEKGIKINCEECYYLSDPKCPDFPHSCALEESIKEPGESRDWSLANLAHRIEMRKKHLAVLGVVTE